MLFKILHGDASRISTEITPFHEGYCYVTHDGYMYIDMNIGTVESPNNQRIKLNALNAETLCGMSLEEIKTFVATQADWSQNDETAVDYVKNRTHYAEDEDTSLYNEADYTIGEDVSAAKLQILTLKRSTAANGTIEIYHDNILMYRALVTSANRQVNYTSVYDVFKNYDYNIYSIVFSKMDSKTGRTIFEIVVQCKSVPHETANFKIVFYGQQYHQLNERFIPYEIARTSQMPKKMSELENDVAATEDEIMALLSRHNVVTPVSDATGYTYTDIDEKILTL